MFDFSGLLETEEERGVKRAGRKVAEAKEAEKQRVREAGVLLVTYLNDGDIPDSPSEPFLEELVTSQQTVPPKIIPLPQELRVPVSLRPQLNACANDDRVAVEDYSRLRRQWRIQMLLQFLVRY